MIDGLRSRNSKLQAESDMLRDEWKATEAKLAAALAASPHGIARLLRRGGRDVWLLAAASHLSLARRRFASSRLPMGRKGPKSRC